MSIKVLKFGGGILKEPRNIFQIIEVVKTYNSQVFIVVSAFNGITDKLLNIISFLEENKYPEKEIKEIKNISLDFLNNTVFNSSLKSQTLINLNKLISELETIALNSYKESKVSPNDISLISCFGEKISSLIINAVFNESGIKCKELLPEECGLYTDDDYVNAQVNIEKSRESILSRITEDTNYIIPGFYGINNEKKITLPGRGGSDYSAASFAACLNAESLDIWKDVAGFNTADPNILKETNKIKYLNYDEAAELAYFGAKILHPQTVVPLKDLNIPIGIFNINRTSNKPVAETLINGKSQINRGIIKSLTFNNNFGILKIKGKSLGIKPGVLAKVATALDENCINIKSVITSQTEINILLNETDLIKSNELIIKLNHSAIEEIQVFSEVSLIALIGEGLINQYGVVSEIFNSVARKNINVEMISLGASNVAIYFIVNKKDCTKAIEVLHNDIFNNNQTVVGASRAENE